MIGEAVCTDSLITAVLIRTKWFAYVMKQRWNNKSILLHSDSTVKHFQCMTENAMSVMSVLFYKEGN
jgi:hypothetical protein